MSSFDPTTTNIANTLAKVTAFLLEQDAINADIEQRIAKSEAFLVDMADVFQHSVSSNDFFTEYCAIERTAFEPMLSCLS
ncbi:hypothetical protein V8B55DRAFT_1487235 [Mucor lusitanicus]